MVYFFGKIKEKLKKKNLFMALPQPPRRGRDKAALLFEIQ